MTFSRVRVLLVTAAVATVGLLPGPSAGAATTARPSVTALSFHSALATGGPVLTITGAHLGHARSVSFGTVRVRPLSATQHHVRVRVPAVLTPRTVNVRVMTDFPRASARGRADRFTWRLPPPQITSVSQHLARTDGTTNAVVRGKYLVNVRNVFVGGVPVAFDHPQAGRLDVQLPEHARGTVQLRVTADGGMSPSGRATAVEYYPPPLISGLDHDDGPATGSTVTVLGEWLGHLTSVTFGGVPAKVLSRSETSVAIAAPAHVAGTVRIVLTTGVGLAFSSYRYGPPNPATWSDAEIADPVRGIPRAVSCPTADFCAMADETGLVTVDADGVHDTYRPTISTWDDVECYSAVRCLAWSGGNADVTVYDGTNWSATTQPTGKRIVAGACSSDSRCRVFDMQGTEAIFDSSTAQWTVTGQTVAKILAVTCSGDTTCTAFAAPGVAYELSVDGSWVQSSGTIQVGQLWSCHSGTECTTFSGHSISVGQRSDAGWAWQKLPDPGFDVQAADCVGSHCIALDAVGHFLVGDGAAWSDPVAYRAYQDWPSVSCWGGGRCDILDHEGRLYPVVDGVLGSTSLVDPFRGGIAALSCPSSAFCLGVDRYGFSLTRVNGTWGTPQAGARSLAVSCASSTFCLSAGSHDVRSWDGDHWSVSDAVPAAGVVQGLSCPVNGFCLVLAGGTPVEWRADSGWQPAPTGGPTLATGLTCWDVGQCAVFTTGGDLVLLHDDVWQSPRKIDAATIPPGPSQITCPAADHCLIGLGPTVYDVTAGGVVRNRILGEPVAQLFCASATSCIVFGQHGDAVLVGGAWSVTAPTAAGSGVTACVPEAAQCVTAATGQARVVTY